MNKLQRKELSLLSGRLEDVLGAVEALADDIAEGVLEPEDAFKVNLPPLAAECDSIASDLCDMHSDEECKYDNMPESFQNGEAGEKLQEIVEQLDNAREGVESTSEYLTTKPSAWPDLIDHLRDALDSGVEAIESIASVY